MRVDRKRALPDVPDAEDRGEDHREHCGADPERYADLVGEDVGVERAGDADDHDGEPVGDGHVLPQRHLDREDEHEDDGEQDRGVHEADAEGHVDPVGEALADGGAEDLDHPEPDGDLGDLVEHLPCSDAGRSGLLGHGIKLSCRACQQPGSVARSESVPPTSLRSTMRSATYSRPSHAVAMSQEAMTSVVQWYPR